MSVSSDFYVEKGVLVGYQGGGKADIVIPIEVKEIGDYAFSGCDIKSFTVHNSLSRIGIGAFKDCGSLTSVRIGRESEQTTASLSDDEYEENAETEICDSAFTGCKALKTVELGSCVKAIGDNAFSDCSSLVSITIGDSVTSIGVYVFSGCSSLASITVASGNSKYHSDGNCLIATENKALIAGCKNSIIPSDGSVTSIYESAFYKCSNLTNITIPESVTIIGSAFGGCSSLTSMTIPNGVKKVVSEAFWGCSSLESITIPDSVTFIGAAAFLNCDSLKHVKFSGSIADWCKIRFDNIAANPVRFSGKISIGGVEPTNLVVTKEVKEILPYAFIGCDSLTRVMVTDGVTNIGNHAFEGCKNIKTVIIAESVREIGDSAFAGCSSLESVVLSGKVKLGRDVFADCPNHKIEARKVAPKKEEQKKKEKQPRSSDSYNFDGFEIQDGLLKKYKGKALDVVIPYGVTSIGVGVFGFSGLKNITIPVSVSIIGDSAFYSCSGLKSITIPNSVTKIGDKVFYYCGGLTSITFQGTKAQWSYIKKGAGWDSYTGAYTVHCTDGNIRK